MPDEGASKIGSTSTIFCTDNTQTTIDTFDNENEFQWSYEPEIEAMFGVHPKAIITDQDPAMKKAIGIVFPNTVHSLTVEEFENGWASMIEKYNLNDNNHLTLLWSIRHQWIPVYFRDTFFANMSTSQRSESAAFRRGSQQAAGAAGMGGSRRRDRPTRGSQWAARGGHGWVAPARVSQRAARGRAWVGLRAAAGGAGAGMGGSHRCSLEGRGEGGILGEGFGEGVAYLLRRLIVFSASLIVFSVAAFKGTEKLHDSTGEEEGEILGGKRRG
uniref:Protein FAR1-RELATED SEQUENCE n=1 Tax=Ananas comosus var. bracteatus TaxID=296719 RepID=A0A6V7Q2N4_ANACO|nr:unnamed protein product [Ananas comosus var. bracteatus]